MDIILPVSEVRGKLAKLVKQIKEENRHLVITKNGRAAAIMISPEELETLEIMADKKLLASIVRAQDDVKAGRVFTHKDVFKHV
jgi:antitoxin YefM